MLIAISGPQSSGKSTVLKEMKKLGYDVIERKTSRSILNEWNIKLSDLSANLDLAVKFQEEITRRKFEDEQAAAHSPNVWFTERTHMDLLTYSVITMGLNNKYSDWITEYAATCINHQQIYDMVFYLSAGHFNPVHDGVRSSNPLFGRVVDLAMMDLTAQHTLPSRFINIQTPVLDQRIITITSYVDALDK